MYTWHMAEYLTLIDIGLSSTKLIISDQQSASTNLIDIDTSSLADIIGTTRGSGSKLQIPRAATAYCTW
jgi:hypothetical protein